MYTTRKIETDSQRRGVYLFHHRIRSQLSLEHKRGHLKKSPHQCLPCIILYPHARSYNFMLMLLRSYSRSPPNRRGLEFHLNVSDGTEMYPLAVQYLLVRFNHRTSGSVRRRTKDTGGQCGQTLSRRSWTLCLYFAYLRQTFAYRPLQASYLRPNATVMFASNNFW